MENKLNTALAALFLTTASFATFAETEDSKKYYVTAGMMAVTTDALDSVAGAGITIDDEDTAPTITIGYQIDDNLSLEAGVIGESDVSATFSGGETGTLRGKTYTITGTVTVKAESDTSYILGAKYATSVIDNFDLYGKAGILLWDLKGVVSGGATVVYDGTTTTITGSHQIYQTDGNDFYYGIGGSYKFNQTTSVNADYLKMEVDDADVDGLSLAVSFDF
jgi:hypothetical protein